MHRKHRKHPLIDCLWSDHKAGNLSRREFLRFAALLGLATTTASHLFHLAIPGHAMGAVYGQKLRIAGLLPESEHPAENVSMPASQVLRQVAEYLTYTDRNNITHPFLLDRWVVSEDLRIWSLHLKKNIFFNNGQAFTADDVIFSIEQWLRPDINSPMKSILGDCLTPSGIRKIDSHLVVLYLSRPELELPEKLFHPSAMILNHRTFEGNFMEAPHGTGPFRIEKFENNIRCLLRRRYDYWQPGLPFLNEIEFLDLGRNISSRVTALKSGTVDLIDLSDTGSSDVYSTLKNDRNIRLTPVPTARANVLRMRVDREPWDDNRVRRALKLCQHRDKIRYLAYKDQGAIGNDFHVCPTHPEYCEKKTIKFDPRRAKSLLAEAGYENGLDIHLTIAEGKPDIRTQALVLQNDAARAGFRIHLQEVPGHEYYRNRTKFDLGITPWAHYPLGVTALKLAGAVDEQGNPGPWNETRWVDEEFSQLLRQAGNTLDILERKALFCKLEKIQMNQGAVGIPCWQNSYIASRKRVQNIQPHPNDYLFLNKVWLKPGKK
jgi:peptide/nickel transport system substrate-binding protein